ncbi:hypothetical protein GCM10010222_06560 [Streptomyces tanashiensis]|uniref:ATP-binding protein n=1 Tax=Streptomyces tanashiensis TaxID=67367 RepID=A0ABY6QX68_9ACTN|nr:hypothetical protein [Streptomyces tanashiensis]UZX22086.1 hypothetical protein LDH80_15720 [Streptomyces tanashiensis]GGS68497.1 hypothetical protein GCM10010222_06560 [Streptomyces tanashiensis]GGY04989.1 hypothetical protein GCM10010299_05180 [Streptomyces tanashiensis]
MKQSAAKKLGVAALGAAFVAAGAGAANAAPSLPLDADALGTVTSAVPLGDGLTTLPDGASESLGAGQGALGQGVDQGVKTLPAAAGQATQSLPLDAAAGGLGATPLGGLLGGLPLGAGGLPIG